MSVCDDAVIQPLCVFVCKCLSAFVSVSVFLGPAEREHPSDRRAQPWCIRAQLPQLHFVKGAKDLNASSQRAGVSHAALCNLFAALELRLKKSHCLQASPSPGV